VAVRELSREVVERVQYQHTGWRNIDGQDLYLHGGGAVGPEGPVESVEVELGENRRLRLVDPGDDLTGALSGSLAVFDVAPLRVTVPLMATVARSALTAADFTFYLHGRTGTFKSELAALAQQHFGPELSARNLISFESTANSLEERAFIAKDLVLVIDDYVTNGSTREVADMRAKAGRLVRAQGNQAGRGRLNRDSQARPVHPPRGTLIMTGEDLPVGHSILARLVAVEVQEGDVDEARLTVLQEQAAGGRLAGAMFGYLRHLAGDLAGHRARHRRRVRKLLPTFRGANARTPVTFAELAASLESYLEFAGAADRMPDYLAVLAEVAAEQGEHQQGEAVTTRFLQHLGAAIRGGAAHLANADDAKVPPDDALRWGWRFREQVEGVVPEVRLPVEPRGDRVGWIRGEDVYLDADNAFAAAQAHALKSGAGDLGVKASTLWKRLKQAGLLASVGHPQTTRARATIWGRRLKTLVHLRSSLSETGPPGPPGPPGPDGPTPGEARASAPPGLGQDDEELGRTGPAAEDGTGQEGARPSHDWADDEKLGQGVMPGNPANPRGSGRAGPDGPGGPVRDGGERRRESHASARATMRLEDLGAALRRQLGDNPEFWSGCTDCGERVLPAGIQVVEGRDLCPRCATMARVKAAPAAEPASSTCSMEGCDAPYWGTVFGTTRTCRRCNGRLRRAVRKIQGGGGEPAPEVLRAAVEQVELDILLG
jgi:hypothetical protein